MQQDMLCRRICCAGGYVVQKDRLCRRICCAGVYLVQQDMLCRRIFCAGEGAVGEWRNRIYDIILTDL